MANQGGKTAVFQETHDKQTVGHLERNRTYDRMKRITKWPGMKELEEDIQQCETSRKNKIT